MVLCVLRLSLVSQNCYVRSGKAARGRRELWFGGQMLAERSLVALWLIRKEHLLLTCSKFLEFEGFIETSLHVELMRSFA